MNTQARAAILVAAVAAIVVAFVLASESSDSDKPAKTATTTETTVTSEATVTTKPAVPATETVIVEDGKPVGGVKTLSFADGDQIKFKVTSNTADEVHVHGYDIEKPVGPGETASFSFKATIEGIFEIELHGSGTEIASLEVTP